MTCAVPYQIKKELELGSSTKFKNASVMIEADKERIFEVISNLLTNAIKITENGEEILVVLDEKDDQAIVRVIDSGLRYCS